MTQPTKNAATYGTWISPIDAKLVANSSIRYAEPQIYKDALFWIEGRPHEKGRSVIVKQSRNGAPVDVIPAPFSARSKVHEYGGGAYVVAVDTVYFVNAADQGLYAADLNAAPETDQYSELDDSAPRQIFCKEGVRLADIVVDDKRKHIICVAEMDQNAGHAKNCLIRIPLGASTDTFDILAQGHDFYSNPRLSPSGHAVCFVTWDNPNMPWDESKLWVAELNDLGDLSTPRCVAGADAPQSLCQPQWRDDTTIFYISDINNWWNLYKINFKHDHEATAECVYPVAADCATPPWTLNMSTYGFLSATHIILTYTKDGTWFLAKLTETDTGFELQDVETDICSIAGLKTNYVPGNPKISEVEQYAFIGGSMFDSSGVYLGQHNKTLEKVTHGTVDDLLLGYISQPRPLVIESAASKMPIYAFYYPPKNQDYCADKHHSKPPCIVICHGGPTGATDTSLNWKIQFWTSRGFALIDVNYRGSTGYGRDYRNALRGRWGISDVEDLAAAAHYVRDKGLAHPDCIAIRGSSAGGFTVLASLTDTKAFNAGVSLYGIADLEILATDTHKFEARYMDGLVGPYPAKQQIYIARSPIHKVSDIDCPVLIFQGLEDKVVPPNQADAMFNSLKDKGLPVARVLYPNEGHGFRQAETIEHQLASELSFYQQVFGLGDTDTSPVLTIENLKV